MRRCGAALRWSLYTCTPSAPPAFNYGRAAEEALNYGGGGVRGSGRKERSAGLDRRRIRAERVWLCVPQLSAFGEPGGARAVGRQSGMS